MTAGIYGLLAALGWGSADFIARFTGRAIGHQHALLGMLIIGTAGLTLVIFLYDTPFVFTDSGWWLLLVSGIGTMVATLLLYQGLARGPVTIVAPIVGCFPVFNVILAFTLGARPLPIQWVCMFAVFTGVWLVALSSSHFESTAEYSHNELRKTLAIAITSSLIFSITVAAIQAASPIYGEIQTVCISRWISLISLSLLFLCKRQAPKITLQCWPLIIIQGLMDTGAYIALAWSAHTANAEIAVVSASGFSIVTVLLARYILKEIMSWTQWNGIILIITGVAILSGF